MPQSWRGIWKHAAAPLGQAPFSALYLDIGCGKGASLVEVARAHPERLVIGIDAEPICIAYAAQAIYEHKLSNALVIPARANQVCQLFAEHEVDYISLSFPTPFPRKKQAALRTTQLDRLLEYKHVLATNGQLLLRTDSQPFLDFSLTQLHGAGFSIRLLSHNLRRDMPELPVSEYERKLSAEGAVTLGLIAEPSGPATPDMIQTARTAEQSLFAYIPDNLYEDAYIPHGMSWAIQAFRYRRANQERKAHHA
ncbi:methyltransferase domain-containing protein [Collinsella sp. zg1085]|nr:methyltransferase domain-containing protein [Collinsella sp. zg1085]